MLKYGKSLWVICVMAVTLSVAAVAHDDTNEAAVKGVLQQYHTALSSNDVVLIETFVVTDDRFVMIEGKHTNWGWQDYRDNHLVGELGDLSKVAIRLDFKRVHVDGDSAYVSFLFALSPPGKPEVNYGSGRATAVLVKGDGVWKIIHLHTS